MHACMHENSANMYNAFQIYASEGPLRSHRYMSSVFLSFSGFESRQPSHVLMSSYPYSPLENRYTFYSHSLRNTGELAAQSADNDVGGFLNLKHSAFQMSCAPASCVLTERQVSTGWRSCRVSGGNCSAERKSRPIRAKYISPEGFVFHTSSNISVT